MKGMGFNVQVITLRKAVLNSSWKTDSRDTRLEPGSWAGMLLQESMSRA